jgi:hypothetical protein
MSTKMMAEKFFPGIAYTTALRRIRKLERRGYIGRISFSEGIGHVWKVHEKAAALVSDKLPKKNFSRISLGHDIVLAKLRFALEEQKISHFWTPEHEIRSQMAKRYGLEELKFRAVPDGIMVVECRGIRESIAVELELNQKNKDRYRRTFGQYKEKENILAVWYLVPSSGLGKSLFHLWGKHQQSRPKFLWSVVDEVFSSPRECLIHGAHGAIKLRHLFSSENPLDQPSPAQEAAQSMSRQDDPLLPALLQPTLQNHSKNPAPVPE